MDEIRDLTSVPKARPEDHLGRHREIVSDPLNLFIRRVPEAGFVRNRLVTLHNGHRVAWRGPESYYDTFSDILIVNRGVHEPLEEFVFQQMLPTLPPAPVMVELGAHWAHYSMWCKQARPAARCIMVEPTADGLRAGQNNFARHGYDGTFEAGMIGTGHDSVDALLARHGVDRLDLLHCDIQGYEVEMLEGAAGALGARRIDRLFISTHDKALHAAISRRLREFGYRIDVSSGFAEHSTSYDGFILAMRQAVPRFLPRVALWGRVEIARATPEQLATYVRELAEGLAQPVPVAPPTV
jgi:hypothetical protein